MVVFSGIPQIYHSPPEKLQSFQRNPTKLLAIVTVFHSSVSFRWNTRHSYPKPPSRAPSRDFWPPKCGIDARHFGAQALGPD